MPTGVVRTISGIGTYHQALLNLVFLSYGRIETNGPVGSHSVVELFGTALILIPQTGAGSAHDDVFLLVFKNLHVDGCILQQDGSRANGITLVNGEQVAMGAAVKITGKLELSLLHNSRINGHHGEPPLHLAKENGITFLCSLCRSGNRVTVLGT